MRSTTNRCANTAGCIACEAARIRRPTWRKTGRGWRRRCGFGLPRTRRRRRLFARACPPDENRCISDRQSWEARLPLSAEGDAAGAVERLMELQRGGVRIRPRALVTTLWARLALGDLFIHGIGGAKYDCVTDRLIERFFGLAPPRFLVVSATLHLPIEHRRATAEEVRAIRARAAGDDPSAGAVFRWGRHSCLPREAGHSTADKNVCPTPRI